MNTRLRFMNLCALLVLGLSTVACRGLGDGQDTGDEIGAVLQAQADAWNSGDIDGFMAEGYWNSEELTFLSGGSWTRGYDPVLERYRSRYVEGDNEMGSLEFTDIEIIQMGGDVALARGHWELTFSAGTTSAGLFTLVLRRLPEGWRVVHDHTSLDS